MTDTIEVTQAMIDAGIDALNKLRACEMALRKRETVEMGWADVLSVAYAVMERQRRLDDAEVAKQRHLAAVFRDMQPVSRA